MSLPDISIEIDGASVECDVLQAVIRHGRDDPSSHPEADSAVLDIIGAMPAGAAIGAALTVYALDPITAVPVPRFAGRISDVRIGFEDVDLPSGTLIAVGELADMGRRVIGDTPYPAEADGTRVNRAITAAGVSTDPIRSDPGYLGVLARDVDAQPALNVARDAATDGGGFVWQATDGAVLYADAFHRRAPAVAFSLEACDLPVSLAWMQGLEGMANDVDVRYGPGATASKHADDPASIATYGTHGASLSTRIESASDAQERANLIVVRQSEPAWTLSALRFALESPGVGLALTSQLLGAEVHDLINVTGMPAGSPMTSAMVFVEGWTETIVAGGWALELSVSDYCRTAPAPQWDDVMPGWLWDGISPGMTWDAISCLPPYVSGAPGRWVDVPASQRWDTVGTTQWDQWTGA
jgi:hypothetical protein